MFNKGVMDDYNEARELQHISRYLHDNEARLDDAGKRKLAVIDEFLAAAKGRDGGYLFNAEKFLLMLPALGIAATPIPTDTKVHSA